MYCRHYFGAAPRWMRRRRNRTARSVSAVPDTLWIPDGIRDREHMRETMQTLFEEAVAASGARSVDLRDYHPTRLRQAVTIIDSLVTLRAAARRRRWNDDAEQIDKATLSVFATSPVSGLKRRACTDFSGAAASQTSVSSPSPQEAVAHIGKSQSGRRARRSR